MYADTARMMRAVDDLDEFPALLGETDELRRRGEARLGEADALKERGMAWLAAHMRKTPTALEKKMVYADALQDFARQLRGHHYFACPSAFTDRPGLADFLAYAYVATSEAMGIDLSGFPQLVEWKSLLDGHPHVKVTRPSWS
jgi:glutathione S-transferase